MDEYFPTVVQVVPLDNFHVQVFFDDGKIVEYDASADLQTELFAPLTWDLSGNRDEANCIDIDPFTLYELDSINNLIA